MPDSRQLRPRGATEASDIDMVVILDQLSASDIHTYDAMLDTFCRELICGFLSGRQELENWEPRSFSSSAATPPP